MVGDPIGDLINRIKTAQMAGLPEVTVPFSKLKYEIASLLLKEGFVGEVSKRGKKVKKFLDVVLKYDNKRPEVTGTQRISKPSRRVYFKVGDIRPVKYGQGLLVLSTPRGILSGKDARKEGVGGEALFKIW